MNPELLAGLKRCPGVRSLPCRDGALVQVGVEVLCPDCRVREAALTERERKVEEGTT